MSAPTPLGLPTASRRHALRSGAVSCLAALGCVLLAQASAADLPDMGSGVPPELAEALPGAQALGSARLRFLGLDVYEARLWSRDRVNPALFAQNPFALELRYYRALSGKLMAERALQEMQRQSSMDTARQEAWREAMQQAFADVQAGDRITGLHLPDLGARFWFNGQSRALVRDADFSRIFFGIWLSKASSEPQMRSQLLGLKALP